MQSSSAIMEEESWLPQHLTSVKRPVVLKLDISADILPRDTQIGTKVLTLVPKTAGNVREVRSYIAKFILKTPVPFQMFVGEYRIRDEEDVQIFSAIDEPCRLVPVPVPRSALSVTPKGSAALLRGGNDDGRNNRSTSTKHVTFFDGDMSTSPVRKCTNSMTGIDVLDQVSGSRKQLIHPFVITSTPINANAANLKNDGKAPDDSHHSQETDQCDDSISGERKKRRRRRHRSKKSKSDARQLEDDITNSETELNNTASESLSTNGEGKRKRTSGSLEVVFEENTNEEDNLPKTKLVKLEDDNDEANDSFEFVTPSILTRSLSSKNYQTSLKKVQLSDSAFSSPGSGSFSSPLSSSDDSKTSGKMKRQDTPNIPRVIKNPRYFENARKIINDFGIEDQIDSINGAGLKSNSESNGFDTKSVTSCNSSSSGDYETEAIIITKSEDVIKGDKLAFKLLELDERYNPSVSDFKEGIVEEVTGTKLFIKFTKNERITRCGKYEMTDDGIQNVSEDECTTQLQFAELIEPLLLGRCTLSVVHDSEK